MTRLNPEDNVLRMRAQAVFGAAALSASEGPAINGPTEPDLEGVATSDMVVGSRPGGSDEAADTGVLVASGAPNGGGAGQGGGSSLHHMQSVSLDEVIADPVVKKEHAEEPDASRMAHS